MSQFLPVYLLFALFLYLTYNYYKNNGVKLFLYILVIYTVSAFCSVMYIHTDFFVIRNKLQYEITYLPFLYWILAFWIVTSPIRTYDKLNNLSLCYSLSIVRYICIVGFLLSLLPLLEMLPKVGTIFNASNLAVMMSDLHDDDDKDLGLSMIGNLCFQLLNYGYSLFLLCILPLFKNLKENKFYLFCVFFVILTMNFCAIINSTRGILVETIINLGVLFVIYLPWLSPKERQKILKYLLGFLLSTFFIFALLTVMRNKIYVQSEESSTLSAFIFQYGGEGFINFNQYMDKIIHHTNGDFCFYTFKRMLGCDVPDTYRGYLYTIEDYVGIRLMIFYTFIGFFVIDIGYWGTLLFFLLISRIVKVPINKIKSISFANLYLIFWYASIIANGTSLYKFSLKASNHIIFMLLIYILLKKVSKGTKKETL